MNLNRIRVRDNILLMLMGFLSFSTMGSKVAIDILHLPMSMPELFFIPIFYILRHHFIPVNFDKDTFVKLVLLQILLVSISVILGFFPLFDVLSSSRGFIYIYLFYCIYKKNNKLDPNDIILISLGSIIGWAMTSWINLSLILSGAEEYEVTYGNMLAASLFMLYTILYKKWKLFACGLVLLLLINFTAGLRRLTFILVVTFVLAYILVILRNKKAIFKNIIFVVLTILPIYLAFPYISRTIEEASPVLYVRVIDKTQKALSGEAGDAGDDIRQDNIRTLIHNLDDFIMPCGMVSFMSLKKYDNLKDGSIGIYMDFPLLALSRIFSFPAILVIILIFLCDSLKCLSYFRVYNNIGAGVYAVMGVVMFSLLFVEGTFINYPYSTPFTGLCLGRISYYAKQYNYNRRSQHHAKQIYQ